MSRASESANAMMDGVEKVCALYGVFVLREQSRTMMVEGVAGRFRPMFIGAWVDHFGKRHTKGKSDLLARPRVSVARLLWSPGQEIDSTEAEAAIAAMDLLKDKTVAVPLWIECKSGTGRMSPDQIAFKNYVEANGEFFLLLHDDVRPLIQWFEERNVRKQPLPSMQYVVEKIPQDAYDEMPCRHCSDPRKDHAGKIFACKPKPGVKLGTVWSPLMAQRARAK